VWGGNPRTNLSAQIFHGKYVVSEFEPRDGWGGPYLGADWGFAADPTVLMRCWIDGRKLLVDGEAYGFGVELDSVPKLFEQVPRSRDYVIRGDSSRPETISHIKARGFRIEAASKWDGSIEDGIAFLRSFEQIVIHPRCTHLQEEARLYSYKRDRLSGDVMPDVVDKHNHCWDSIRYALEPLVRRSRLAIFAWSETEHGYSGPLPVGRGIGEETVVVAGGMDQPTVFLACFDDGRTVFVDKEYVSDENKADGQFADDLGTFMNSEEAGGRKCTQALVLIPPGFGSFDAQLLLRGIWRTEGDARDVEDGLRMVASMLSLRMLKFSRERCPRLMARIAGYRFDPKKEVADPLCDALRMFVKTRIAPWRITEDTVALRRSEKKS
jgi:hypothetical protein